MEIAFMKHANAIAVGLLAIAVLVLAIKEPRCEQPPEADGGRVAPIEGAGSTRRQPRELRKF